MELQEETYFLVVVGNIFLKHSYAQRSLLSYPQYLVQGLGYGRYLIKTSHVNRWKNAWKFL